MKPQRAHPIVAVTLMFVVACSGSSPEAQLTTTTSTALSSTTVPAVTTTSVPPTSTTSSPPTTLPADPQSVDIDVTVSGGAVVGGGRTRVPLGTLVRLRVAADTPDEVHVHGYDIMAPVTPDEPAILEFTADIPGIFEVELETAGLPIVELEVSP